MPLDIVVSPVNKADLRDLAYLFYDAYGNDITMVNYYPPGLTNREEFADLWSAYHVDKWEAKTDKDHGNVFMKACVKGSTKALACAIWSTARQWVHECAHKPVIKEEVTEAQSAFGRIRDVECIHGHCVAEWVERRKFFPDGAPHWFLCDIVVAPEYQRQGLGTALIKTGLSLATSDPLFHGSPKVMLLSLRAGYELYKKLGFVEVGVMYKPCEYAEEDTTGEYEETGEEVWRFRSVQPVMVWTGFE